MNHLQLKTITPEMNATLERIMQIDELRSFRLVGGTALSLLLGHRLSIDLDFFTDEVTDFSFLVSVLPDHFSSAMLLSRTATGQTWSINNIKCDFYNWKVPYSEPPIIFSNIRLASVKDIAAFKLEAYANRRSEKDYIDIAEILKSHSFESILNTFRVRYPFIQPSAVLPPLLDPKYVVRDSSIVILNGSSFDESTIIIQRAIKMYEHQVASKAEEEKILREHKLKELISRKKRKE